MHFTSGASRAFEKLMKSKPGFDHYDSGSDGEYEECRSCHYTDSRNAECGGMSEVRNCKADVCKL